MTEVLRKTKCLMMAALFLFLGLVDTVRAQEETFADKFLGSPLLVLTIIIVIAFLAMVFHRLRK